MTPMKYVASHGGRGLRGAVYIAVVGLVAAVLSVATSSPASAGNGQGPLLVGPASHQSVEASATVTSDPGTQALPCQSANFCFFYGLDGTGNSMTYQPQSCGEEWNIGYYGYGDQIESVQNNTWYTVYGYNWTGSYWQELWRSVPGHGGNLSPEARNKTDMLKAVCP
jgi:Peptidase inhibitor family I36